MSIDVTDPGQVVVALEPRLELGDVLRAMGSRRAKPPTPERRAQYEGLFGEAIATVDARAAFAVHAVETMDAEELGLAGCPPILGPIATFMKPVQRVAVFVATIGDALEGLSRERIDAGRTLEGFVLDAVGSVAADAASEALAEHLMAHVVEPDEAVTAPFSPGYCGMSLDQQEAIFSIVDAEPLGVSLSESMLMTPLKSVSGLIGIGPREEIGERGVPCRWCDLEDCHMRRGDSAKRPGS